jgi:hypothetical protein
MKKKKKKKKTKKKKKEEGDKWRVSNRRMWYAALVVAWGCEKCIQGFNG